MAMKPVIQVGWVGGTMDNASSAASTQGFTIIGIGCPLGGGCAPPRPPAVSAGPIMCPPASTPTESVTQQ